MLEQFHSGRVPPHQSAYYRNLIIDGNHRREAIRRTEQEVTQENPKHS